MIRLNAIILTVIRLRKEIIYSMAEKSYHHGNLKNELIEKGIKYISTNGAEGLSMRKLATVCGVSSAAPYAHFKNKSDFMLQARSYVEDVFSSVLLNCIETNKDQNKLLMDLGKCYVMFFVENPHYNHFMFSDEGIVVEEYRPYKIFSGAVSEVLKSTGLKKKEIYYYTLFLWAEVQGLTDICTVCEMFEEDKLEKEVEKILSLIKF